MRANVECVKRYTVEEVMKNPNKIYVFGDNLLGYGKGGQAIIRECPNVFGIPTKRKPSMENDAFFSDTQEEFNIVFYSLLELKDLIHKGYHIVFPCDGVGTGLAKLKEHAPRIHRQIQIFMEDYCPKCKK